MHAASGERNEGGRVEGRRALATWAGLLQVVSRRQDEDALDFLAEVGPKVTQVAGNEMRRSCFDCGKKDGNVFVRQQHPVGKLFWGRVE